ncbi:helix-turn-helix transcriptional regulator [Lacticaseibacillus hulanensis]|uniref:helix-turn-helix transcriptional regulator n=1 Tax=Lacticaseibacillus hulanensis TaxID=2493111 RepID=UPI000FD9E524|nr:DNA-binding protein [Lacticaseibacillus hulanensis]
MLTETDVERIAKAVVAELKANRQQSKSRWLTATEAAKYIGRSRSKFYAMKREGEFEAHDGLYSTDELDLAIGRLPQ